MKVTIYILNFNYGRFLERAIQSCINQTYENLDIIIIDDGSSDGSIEVIKRYEKVPRITVICQDNRGLVRSCNTALYSSNGELIMRLDADDFLAPNAVEVMVAIFLKDSTVGLVYPDYVTVDESGEVIASVEQVGHGASNILDRPAHGACTLFRKSILIAKGGYDEDFDCQDGWDLWFKVAFQTKVVHVNEFLFFYTQHSQSLSKNTEKLLKTRGEIISKNYDSMSKTERKFLAVVPLRDENTDPRSVILKKLGRRNICEWTIDSLLSSKMVDHVVAVCSSRELAVFLEKRYCERISVCVRELADSRLNAPLNGTLKTALAAAETDREAEFTDFAVAFAEFPFRRAEDIDVLLRSHVIFGASQTFVVNDISSAFKTTVEGLKLLYPLGFRRERNSVKTMTAGLRCVALDERGIDACLDIDSATIAQVTLPSRCDFEVKDMFSLEMAQAYVMSEDVQSEYHAL